MNAFLLNKNIDLVDFEDLKLFMFEDDNLYKIAVAEDRKRQSLADYQKLVIANGYPLSTVTLENINQVSKARFGVYLFLNHLWEHNINFTVLDIGSHIGDFSMKIGNYIRTFNQHKHNKVISFDPTEAGALVGYNIELNGLNDIVHHENLAVADYNGLMLFNYTPGFSDSAQFAINNNVSTNHSSRFHNFLQKPFREKLFSLQRFIINKIIPTNNDSVILPSYNLIVRGVDILHYLELHNYKDNLFIKIDIEGFDNIVIDRLLLELPKRLISMIFEFTPNSYKNVDNAIKYLENLSNSFYLFDLYYSPNPTRFCLIDPKNFSAFVEDVIQRKFGYTDIFSLDKRVPGCEVIKKRLSNLVETQDDIVL